MEQFLRERNKQQQQQLEDYDYDLKFLPYSAQAGTASEGQSEHLVDLPQDLQELQQQLLEAAKDKKEVTSHDLEVEPGTGWPWYVATLPPGDFYDCLFLYFSCSDYEKPGWPDNKEKCTNLFNYCITYVDKHNNTGNNNNNNNGLKDDDPFVVKIPISSEIISNGGSSNSGKPSEPITEPATLATSTARPSSSSTELSTSSTSTLSSSTTTSTSVRPSRETPEPTPGATTLVSTSSTQDPTTTSTSVRPSRETTSERETTPLVATEPPLTSS